MNVFCIIINAIIIIICLILIALLKNSYSETTHLGLLLMAIVSIITYLICNFRNPVLKKVYLRTSFIFVLGYVIVYFQYNIDLLFGYIKPTNAIFPNPSVINTACLLSVIGFASFVIGNIIGLVKTKIENNPKKSIVVPIYLYRLLSVMLFSFVAIYMYYNALTILTGKFYYNTATMERAAGSLSNYSNVMVYVCIFVKLACKTYDYNLQEKEFRFFEYIWNNGILFNLSVILYLSFIFMTGDRGPLITITLAHIISFQTASKRKIRPLYLVIGIIVAGFIITGIGQIRRTSNIIYLNDLFSSNLEQKQSISPLTRELAGSYNTFTYCVNKIPDEIGYFNGAMQLRDITYSVPFAYRVLPFIYSHNEHYNSSSAFCTYLIQGANSTYGNGSSILVNAYADFGILGIIGLMFILGLIIVKIDYELYYNSGITWSVVAISFFSFSLYISRANIYLPIYYIIPSLLILMLFRINKRILTI